MKVFLQKILRLFEYYVLILMLKLGDNQIFMEMKKKIKRL